ncbi:MAG: hypothetical protein IJ298_04980 [Ruminococcus sp.]|nr:hypothetical protein [Ruminococcus sp.]
MELKLLNNKKKKNPVLYIVLGAVVFVFLIACFVKIADIQNQIAEKEAELESIQNEIRIQEIKNSELEHVLNYSDEEYLEYVINKAHSDLDYVRQGERVFVNSAGN